MPIARVQIIGSVPPSGTIGSAVFAAPPAAGNLVVASFSTFGGTIPLSSVGDSAGNTYTRRAFGTATGPQFIAIYSAENIVSGANFTVFGTESAAHGVTTVISEYSGAVAVSPFDSGGSAKATSGSVVNSGTATTTQADEMAIAAFTHNGGSIAINESLAGGWTAGTKLLDGNSYQPINVVDNILASTAAVKEVGTIGASQSWNGVIATFKAAPVSSVVPLSIRALMGVGV